MAAGSISIRTISPDDWQRYRDARLGSLADAPDAFGSTFAEEQLRPAEWWAGRVAAAAVSGIDCPLIAEVEGRVVGLVWAKLDASNPSLVNLFQMWVAEQWRGRGIAARLLADAIDWARSKNARVVQLGVTCGDTSATRLYQRTGFQAFGETELLRTGSPLLSQPMRLALDRAPA